MYKIIIFVGRFKMAEIDLERCLELDSSFQDARINLEQVKKELQKELQKTN